MLRLAFFAAENGYNAVTKVDLRYEKVRDEGGYQTTLWHGSGYAATLDGRELDL